LGALTDLLGIRHPLVQAPMSGVSTPELAAAVSAAGALGSIGGGWLDPDALRAAIREIRARTDAPFNVNLFAWAAVERDPARVRAVLDALAPLDRELGVERGELLLPFDPPERLEQQLEVVAEERVPVFSFTFGIPPLDAVRSAGAVVLGTATTADEAEALERAGVDVVVAQGAEAGGHRGTFLHAAEDALIGTVALVPQVVERVSVPVLAAGGIMDGRGIAAALDLGAQGAQLGTAFVGCPESSAPVGHRARLGDAARTTVVTDTVTGRAARGFRSHLTDLLSSVEPLPYPLQQLALAPILRRARELGRDELAFFLVGQGAPAARALPAAVLVELLAVELRALEPAARSE
jgi:nitronate monooxygenase